MALRLIAVNAHHAGLDLIRSWMSGHQAQEILALAETRAAADALSFQLATDAKGVLGMHRLSPVHL